jgi:hypothetical protein
MVESRGVEASERACVGRMLSADWLCAIPRLNRERRRGVKPTTAFRKSRLSTVRLPNVLEVASYGRMEGRGLSCGSSVSPLFSSP